MSLVFRGRRVSRRIVATCLALTALAACASEPSGELDPSTSLYALVQTVDGTSFYPPLGPSPVPVTGTFDASLLSRLRIVLEATGTDGEVRTIAIFDSRSSPVLSLYRPFEAYGVNLPAASYFTDPTSAYRFRVLLDGAELGRSDLSDRIFSFIASNPSFLIGVKVRIETRPVPTITSISPTSAPRDSDAISLTVQGSRISSDSIVRVAGQSYGTRRDATGALITEIPATLLTTPGNYPVSIFTPAPGGGASGSIDFSVYDPAPVVEAVVPATASAGGAAVVLTVDGTHFTDLSSVRLNGAALATTFISANRLTAIVAASSLELAGARTISVLNPPSRASNDVAFTVTNPVPSLGAITPAAVMAESNTFTLTVFGAGFTRQSSVVVEGRALATTFASTNELRATVTADLIGAPGTRSVAVTSPAPGGGTSGTSSLSITSPVPSLVSVSPSTALLGALGTTITLDGSSFLDGAVAVFGATPLATTYVSRARLTAVVPASLLATAGAASIHVENPEPFDAPSESVGFTVLNPAPVITAVSPGSTSAGAPRALVTIAGSSFLTGATVTLSGSPLTVNSLTSDRISVEIPGNLLTRGGFHTLTVSNPAPAAGSASETFTVNNVVPTITSISPESVPVGTMNTVMLTIDGRDFVNPTYVAGGLHNVVTYVSPTRLVLTVAVNRFLTAADYDVLVRNPLPTPGPSNTLVFHVTAPACDDGVQNADETGIDCGGSCLPCFDQGCPAGDATCTEASVGLASMGGVPSASDSYATSMLGTVNDGAAAGTSGGWANGGQASSRLMVRLARPYQVFGLGMFWGGSNGGWRNGTNYHLPTSMRIQVSTDPAALASDPVTSTRWTALTDVGHLLGSSTGTVSGGQILPGLSNAAWNSTQAITFNRVEASAIRVVFDGDPASNGGTNFVGLVGELDVLAAVASDGAACTTGAACESGVCDAGYCAAPSCTDGVKNGTESDVDCGGICGTCTTGQSCVAGSDCAERVCGAWVCQAPTCADGTHNGVETDVDCGGSCGACGDGLACNVDAECTSRVCDAGSCAAPSCFDNVRNGTESDVDCGSHCALRCSDGLRCTTNLDCTSGLCTGNVCQVSPPVLASVSPASVTAGSGNLVVTLTGSLFTSASVVALDGASVPTTFVSSTELRATLPASSLTVGGTRGISVTNPPNPGSSATRTFTVENPMPVLTSVNPAVGAAASALTVTLNGSGFVTSSYATFDNAAIATTYVSSTQLTAVVPAASIPSAGSHELAVVSPAPAGGTSASRTLTVNTPVPVATLLSPSTILAGSAQFTLTVTGSSFVSGATVVFDGLSLATTVVSTTRVTAVVPATSVAGSGVYQVTVVNPAPGGGPSGGLPFTVSSGSGSFWAFDEGRGVATVDGSGNGYTLALVSGPTWVARGAGQALEFRGNAYATPAGGGIPLGSSWTISADFLYPFNNGNTTSWHTLTRGTGCGDHQIIVATDGALGSYDNCTNTGFRSTGYRLTGLSAGWHRLSAVGSAGTTAFFIDGVQVGTIPWQSTSNVYSIGNTIGGGQAFGTIDNVQIVLPIPANNYYSFDEGTGALAHDSSGGVTGTIVGNPPWVQGVSGTALSFSGNQYVTTSAGGIPLGPNWRISAQFQYPFVNGNTTRWHTITRGTGCGDHQIIIGENQVSLGSYDNCTNTGFRDSGFRLNTLSPGWHEVTAWAGRGRTIFFIDGAQVGNIPWASTSNVYWIGNYATDNQSFGTLDEVQIDTFTTPPPPPPASVWALDEASGTTVRDGTTLVGTLSTGANWVANGWSGSALHTTGNGGVNLGGSGVALGSYWTISAFFQYPFANGNTASWHTLTRGTGCGDHQIIVNPDQVSLGGYDNCSGGAFRDSGFRMNTLSAGWHHVAAVGMNGMTIYYIDGVAQGVVSNWSSTSNVYSAGNYQGGGQAWGTFDGFRIDFSALSPSEVCQLAGSLCR